MLMTPAVSTLMTRGPFAHRGLWSPDGAPENSLAALDAACAASCGMELDVRLSADGEAVVFHDDTLERMTGERERVRDLPAAALADRRLCGTGATIPTLTQALAVIAGRTPVLVELKTDVGEAGPLERRVAELLSAYAGPAAVLGFNPDALLAVRAAAPDLLIGLNAAPHVDESARLVEPDPSRVLRHVARVRPDFLSLGQRALRDGRPASDLPIVAWTLRSPEELAAVRPHCDAFMFEGFRP